MKYIYMLVILFTLSACSSTATEKSNENKANYNENSPGNKQNASQTSSGYFAKDEGKLSTHDSAIAYEMCAKVLDDYYKAIWNGTDIDLDAFIENDNLKRYTQKKIQSQHDLYAEFNNKVENIKIGDKKVEFTDDKDGGYLYLKLPVEINMTTGSRGEVTEFLVRNIKGKLFIVDWYSGTKDSYDFTVRGENQTINNPDIWNDGEWVKKLDSKMEM
ncbi:hypothetical protein [Bacillus kwashiorkori]|uniref:hypothetical protein n=1 Tax=Bacillus kwashiorkori TaxID=1522318 RepID=UPI0007824B39|nr:hypothetical protein [Bacillus kwashiorkori]